MSFGLPEAAVSAYFIGYFAFRIRYLAISKAHERQILKEGGYEKGKAVTATLASLFLLYTFACPLEAYLTGFTFDYLCFIGITINSISLYFLYKIVQILGDLWTVKLMVAKSHPLIKHPLIDFCKHPNYYLNITPEIISLSIIFHSWWSLATVGSAIFITLALRIREENGVIANELIDPDRLIQQKK